jgi:hypothetical protein
VKRAIVMAISVLLALIVALPMVFGQVKQGANAEVQKQKALPYTFFFTHYQLLGNP